MKDTVKTYKGYEIHPLIYPRGARDGVAVRAADAGYEASVRIRRAVPEGEEAAGDSRVFRVTQPRRVRKRRSGAPRMHVACREADRRTNRRADGRRPLMSALKSQYA